MPDPEGEVRRRLLAVEVDVGGALEAAVVAVGRREADVEDRAGRDRHAVQLDVDGGLAQQPLHRRLEAQHLLEKRSR